MPPKKSRKSIDVEDNQESSRSTTIPSVKDILSDPLTKIAAEYWASNEVIVSS